MFTNPYASFSFAAPKSAFNFTPTNSQPTVRTPEEIEAENKKLEKQNKKNEDIKKGEALPNHITVGISAANGDLRNRNEADKAAVANGIIMADIIRIHKGGEILFYTADGELCEEKLIANQRVALKLGKKADSFVSKFQELAPGIGGSRACTIKIAFDCDVEVNSMSTIEIADLIFLSEMSPGISKPPSNIEEYRKKRDEAIASSLAYRENKRKEYKDKDEAERLAQLAAAMGVKLPDTSSSEPDSSPAEETFTANSSF